MRLWCQPHSTGVPRACWPSAMAKLPLRADKEDDGIESELFCVSLVTSLVAFIFVITQVMSGVQCFVNCSRKMNEICNFSRVPAQKDLGRCGILKSRELGSPP